MIVRYSTGCNIICLFLHILLLLPHEATLVFVSLHVALHTCTQHICIGSPKSARPKSSRTSARYELPSSATAAGEDHLYEHVELRPATEHESAVQYEEIGLSTNAAYGRVRR